MSDVVIDTREVRGFVEEMRVDEKSCCWCRVAELAGDEGNVGARGDQDRGVRVAQVVEAEQRVFRRLLEPSTGCGSAKRVAEARRP